MKKILKDSLFKLFNNSYISRLLIGTGKYKNLNETFNVIKISEVNIITISIRNLNIDKNKNIHLLNLLSKSQYTILPNTAGCYNKNDAIYISELSRELLNNFNFIKLEILDNNINMLPNMLETFKAVEYLIKNQFNVMVYCNDDPVQIKILENMGVIAVMPLASKIGSGLGILNKFNLSLIIKNSKIPVLIDSGIGNTDDVVSAMQMGCNAVLMNTAISKSKNPINMAMAMKHAVYSGRQSFLSKRMKKYNLY